MPAPPLIDRVPLETLLCIFKLLDPSSLKSASLVCGHWHRIIRTHLFSKITISRSLEGPSNQRFNNATWRILAAPMIDMQGPPAVQMHGALVRLDSDPTVRKNNIESVHRSAGAESSLMTPRQLPHLQDTHEPRFSTSHPLAAMQAQLVVPHAFSIRYKFKLSFAALQTFSNFSQSVNSLYHLCRSCPNVSFEAKNEPFLKPDEVQGVLMKDENLFPLPDLDAVMENSTSCVLCVFAESTPTPAFLKRLVRAFQETVPYTRRARALFLHSSELNLECFVPKRVPFDFVRVSRRRHLSRGWRLLYDKISPPHISVAARRSFLQAIKNEIFAEMRHTHHILSRGGVPVYPPSISNVPAGFDIRHVGMFMRRHIQSALSLYVYRGVRKMPSAPKNMALYAMHCVAWCAPMNPARQEGRLGVRLGSPAPLAPMQQRNLDITMAHLHGIVAEIVL